MRIIVRLLLLIALTGIVVACGSEQAGHSPGSVGSPAAGGTPAAGGSPPASASPDTTTSPAATHGSPAAASAIIAGTVSAGPVTPLSRPGRANSRPVPGVRVEVLRGGRVAAAGYTDHDGRFRFTVRPGTYEVLARAAGFRVATTRPRTVTALAGREQVVDFEFDTGIR